jgi:hypothetical protein
MLRAVVLSEGADHKPENLLDVVDRRTLVGLLRFAGLYGVAEFPRDLDAFFGRQKLVTDPIALEQIRCVLGDRRIAAPHRPARETTR